VEGFAYWWKGKVRKGEIIDVRSESPRKHLGGDAFGAAANGGPANVQTSNVM
jgi:hypothetical protein